MFPDFEWSDFISPLIVKYKSHVMKAQSRKFSSILFLFSRTINEKIKSNLYKSIGDCLADFKLMFSNCMQVSYIMHPQLIVLYFDQQRHACACVHMFEKDKKTLQNNQKHTDFYVSLTRASCAHDEKKECG